VNSAIDMSRMTYGDIAAVKEENAKLKAKLFHYEQTQRAHQGSRVTGKAERFGSRRLSYNK
jgi:hypothetical protein